LHGPTLSASLTQVQSARQKAVEKPQQEDLFWPGARKNIVPGLDYFGYNS
jgi:hypothetical protein